MKRTATLRTMALCLALALAATAPWALAGDGERTPPAKTDTRENERAESNPQVSSILLATGGESSSSDDEVYGNDDLERMFGAAPVSPPSPTASDSGSSGAAADARSDEAAAPAETESALDQLLGRQALAQERAQEVSAAEERVATARQRVADLEKRVLAVKNPFLARPGAPDEGAEEWESGDGSQRLKQAEDQLRAARDELAEAERELAELPR